MKIFIILLVILCVWVVCIKLSVTAKRNRTLISFKELDTVLQKRYKILKFLLNFVKANDISQRSHAEYCENLMEEAIFLGTKPQNIDRRIVFDKELREKADQILAAVSENTQFQSNSELKTAADEYNDFNISVKEAVEKYNYDAHVLRLAVDTFPSSFIARLSNIKYFDSI